MRLDWVNILATVIFVSIVVTLILAVASYFAYKVREARRPRSVAAGDANLATTAPAAASAPAPTDSTTRV